MAIWRRIASFLLFALAAVDMSAPGLCRSERVLTSSFSHRLNAADASLTGPVQPNQSKDTNTSDDDCFCCCIHIVPTPFSAIIAVFNVDSFSPRVAEQKLANGFLLLPYHPPRA